MTSALGIPAESKNIWILCQQFSIASVEAAAQLQDIDVLHTPVYQQPLVVVRSCGAVTAVQHVNGDLGTERKAGNG